MNVVGRVKLVGEDLVIVLDEVAQTALNAVPGDSVIVSKTGGHAEDDERLERGRRFLERYRSTFEALAK